MENANLNLMLDEMNLETAQLSGSDGGSILACDAGARVLRLTGRSGHDFFWMNPSLAGGNVVDGDPATGWRNMGGDRTWIGPESDVHICDLQDPWNTYRVPEACDPGCYRITVVGEGIGLTSEFSLRNHRLGSDSRLRVEKRVTAVANPLREMEADAPLLSAEYIGYEQSTTLSLLSEPDRGERFGLWNLIQLELPTEMLVPLIRRARPHTYFGLENTAQMTLSDDLVRFRADGSEMRKIGIKADAVTGRIGSLRELCDGTWMLIVRSIETGRLADYVDTPWDRLDDVGYATQCFSDGGGAESFAELEYHTPGVGCGTGTASRTDCSRLWAFRGDRSVIRKIACLLMNTSI